MLTPCTCLADLAALVALLPAAQAMRTSVCWLRQRGFPFQAAHVVLCTPSHHVAQDVQRNLEPKNRDKFTQNLTIVRHEFKSKV